MFFGIKRKFLPIFFKSGFSLVELLIAVSILGVVALGVASLMTDVDVAVRDTQVTNTRDQIARDIVFTLENLSLVKMSAAGDVVVPGNLSLNACLTPRDPARPNKCLTSEQPFNLYAKGGPGLKRIAGIPTNPVYYTRKGAICTTSRCEKFFKAEAWFAGTCFAQNSRTLQNSCDQARAIQLEYQVTALMPLSGGRMLNSRPQNRRESTVTHIISGILANQPCPVNAKMSGYTLDGKIICSCVAGAVQQAGTPNTDQIVCTLRQNQCQTGEVWLGFETNGLPRCAKKMRTCKTKTKSDSVANGIFCDKGGWAEQVSMGTCHALDTGGKKGGDYDIDCPDASLVCCYEDHVMKSNEDAKLYL